MPAAALLELGKVFRRVGFELFDAGFAAEFDFLIVINLRDRSAHAAQLVIRYEADFERVGGRGSRKEPGAEEEAGEEY